MSRPAANTRRAPPRPAPAPTTVRIRYAERDDPKTLDDIAQWIARLLDAPGKR